MMKWGNNLKNVHVATLGKIVGVGLIFFLGKVAFTADRCKL